MQEALLNSALNTVGFDGLGLVFTPVWERKQGLLYKIESLLLDKIANASDNCDEKAVLSVDQSPHGRDKRPFEYPIRLCFPQGEGGKKAFGAKFL